MIFIVIGSLLVCSVIGYIFVHKKLSHSDDSSYETLQDQIQFLTNDLANQNIAHTHQAATNDDSLVGAIQNYIINLFPVVTDQKLDLLNKAGLRYKNAYNVKILDQVSQLCIGVVIGFICGTLIKGPDIGLLLSGVLGYLMFQSPWSQLESIIKERSLNIDRTLPDVIDLFANACSAGTTFDIAADLLICQLPNTPTALPIKEDLLAWQQDIKHGVERSESWVKLYTRSQSKNIKYFANLMDQSEKTGGSIAESLLKMAEFFRERRKQQIESDIAGLKGKLAVIIIISIALPLIAFMIIPIGLEVANQMSGVL